MLSFSENYFIVRRNGVARARKTLENFSYVVQSYACIIVAGLRKYGHVSEALKSLKWLSVRDKLLFNDLVMVYKCLKNLTPGYLHGRFQKPIMTLRCLGIGWPLAKRLSPTVG